MSEIVVFGADAFAQSVFERILECGAHNVHAFTVDRSHLRQDIFLGLPGVPFDELPAKYPPSQFQMLVAIGYSGLNQVRSRRFQTCIDLGYELESFIDPSSTVSSSSTLGKNCIVLENNTVRPFAVLEDNVLVLRNNVIEEYAVVGSHTYVSARVTVGREARLGNHSFLGICSTVKAGSLVGERSVVAARSMVEGIVEPDSFVVGSRMSSMRRSAEGLG